MPGPRTSKRNLFRNSGYPDDRRSLVTWVILSFSFSLCLSPSFFFPANVPEYRRWLVEGRRDEEDRAMSSSSLASRSRVAGVCARANSAHPSLSSRVSPSLFRSLNVSVKVSGPTHRLPSPPLPLWHSTHSGDAPRVFPCVTLIGSLYNVYIKRERAREKVNYICINTLI